MSMQDSAVASILKELRSSPSRETWQEFLRQYSPVIFQTCQYSTSNADQAADCFLFACEQLCRNNFRRLLRFRLEGSARFSTWLRVVVRNLCLDWLRKQFGRPRLFRSIARLSQLDGEVYRCRYEQGLSLDETLVSLCPSFPGLTMEQLAAAEEQVEKSLSSRQLWLMSTRRASLRMQGQETSVGLIDTPAMEPMDARPNPESVLADQEQEDRVRSAVGKLPKLERLLIRLRFEEALSLQEIAGLTGLGDAQRVHRRVAEVLEKLRQEVN
jgi:RNA polymerase sigma factor (sigma-70 family)